MRSPLQQVVYFKALALLLYCLMVQFETDDAHERMCEDRRKVACNRRKKERVH